VAGEVALVGEEAALNFCAFGVRQKAGSKGV
jgi:hypothetical protein